MIIRSHTKSGKRAPGRVSPWRAMLGITCTLAVVAVAGPIGSASAAEVPCKITASLTGQLGDTTYDSNVLIRVGPNYNCDSSTSNWGRVGPFSRKYPDGNRGEVRLSMDDSSTCTDRGCDRRVVEKFLCFKNVVDIRYSQGSPPQLSFRCETALHHRVIYRSGRILPEVNRWDWLGNLTCETASSGPPLPAHILACYDPTYTRDGILESGIVGAPQFELAQT